MQVLSLVGVVRLVVVSAVAGGVAHATHMVGGTRVLHGSVAKHLWWISRQRDGCSNSLLPDVAGQGAISEVATIHLTFELEHSVGFLPISVALGLLSVSAILEKQRQAPLPLSSFALVR